MEFIMGSVAQESYLGGAGGGFGEKSAKLDEKSKFVV
jgi:hypothetical protein